MHYWDGFQWVNISAGPNNATLKDCNGIPTWVVTSCPFKIGDIGPAGGTVFYLTDSTGLHGLEVAPIDPIHPLTTAASGCYGSIGVFGFTEPDGIGVGASNTNTIVTKCPDVDTAAKIADAYTVWRQLL
ncbi:MAG: hypothetical protein NTY69_02410 [Methylococcales bacterium]|nr:hypothetical protein [Methylococcales bacterium]